MADTPRITQITVEIGETKLTLSLEEARGLLKALEGVVGDKTILLRETFPPAPIVIPIYPEHPEPRPYYEITWGGNTAEITFYEEVTVTC